LIRHCSASTSAAEAYADLVGKTDEQSPFERDLLRHLVERGYRTIRPQHGVGNYRIDFVIDGPSSRLALECDGDRFHGPEQWEADRARQAVLERAGWTFVRIRGSAFYRNPSTALAPLWARLEELGIPPFDWTAVSPRDESPLQKEEPTLRDDQEPTYAKRDEETETGAGVTTSEKEPRELPRATEATQPHPNDSDPKGSHADADPWAAAFRAAELRLQSDRDGDPA
jgi:very-short-patch-repair endonuclease